MGKLHEHLENLFTGIPSDHMNRQDARITALEESMKSVLQHLTQQDAAPAAPADYPEATRKAIDDGMQDG